MSLDRYQYQDINYKEARKSIKLRQNKASRSNIDEQIPQSDQEQSGEQAEQKNQKQQKKPKTKLRKNKSQVSKDNQNKQDQDLQQLQEEQQGEKKIKVGKKKKIKKQQQNQGIRIAKQKKIQYIFRNICNPNGKITLQSLGRALVKHKIQFKVSELQQMLALCATDHFSEQQSCSFDSQISQSIRAIGIDIDNFKEFYKQKF